MSMMSNSTDDTLTEKQKLEIGINGAKTDDLTKKVKEDSKEE